jgi:hypothetical protein
MGEESVAGWFAVRTRPGAEGKVLIGLEAARMPAYLPAALNRINYRGNHRQPAVVMWRPVFMGCVFAMLDPSRDLPALREVEGVDDVLRLDGKPAPVADDFVKALRSAERRELFDLAAGCRVPDDETAPLDSRFASLMTRIKRGGSKERAQLLIARLPDH